MMGASFLLLRDMCESVPRWVFSVFARRTAGHVEEAIVEVDAVERVAGD